MATLHEIQTQWSYKDLMDAHETLDVQAEIEEWQYKKNNPQSGI